MGKTKRKINPDEPSGHTAQFSLFQKAKFKRAFVLCKKAFWQILKRGFIDGITGQNVQRLQISAILASFLWGNLKLLMKMNKPLPQFLTDRKSFPCGSGISPDMIWSVAKIATSWRTFHLYMLNILLISDLCVVVKWFLVYFVQSEYFPRRKSFKNRYWDFIMDLVIWSRVFHACKRALKVHLSTLWQGDNVFRTIQLFANIVFLIIRSFVCALFLEPFLHLTLILARGSTLTFAKLKLLVKGQGLN